MLKPPGKRLQGVGTWERKSGLCPAEPLWELTPKDQVHSGTKTKETTQNAAMTCQKTRHHHNNKKKNKNHKKNTKADSE